MSLFGQAYFGTGARFGETSAPPSPPRRAMASNELPDPLDRLFPLCDHMLGGLATHEVPLNVKQNTAATLAPYLTSARGAETDYGNKRSARKAANDAKVAADLAGKVFIGNARKRLSKFFGESYNTEWAAAGWPDGSTATPKSEDKRFELIESIRLHLVGTPAHASVDMDVTAAIAQTLHTNLSDARTDLGQKQTDQGNAKVLRDLQVAALRKRMRGLITELATLMDDDDPRWYAFGLSRPADEETPEAPINLILLPSVPGSIIADWDDALRADRYRVWRQVVGVDADFVAVETVYDSDASLAGLPTGATVKIQVTSVNDAGESAPSAVVEIVVP